jgi:hypothetical protein
VLHVRVGSIDMSSKLASDCLDLGVDDELLDNDGAGVAEALDDQTRSSRIV